MIREIVFQWKVFYEDGSSQRILEEKSPNKHPEKNLNNNNKKLGKSTPAVVSVRRMRSQKQSLHFWQLQMDKLQAKPARWGSVVVNGLGGAYMFSPQMGERWIHHPALLSVFQEHTEHLAQYWCRLFSMSSQNPLLSMLWRSDGRSLHQTTLGFYVVIWTNITATDKIPQMSEGEKCKWGIHWLGGGIKRELAQKQPHSDITLRRNGLFFFSEKGGLLFFIGR